MSTIKQDIRARDTLGASALRPDGVAKVTGSFSFSSDMWAENMLWGATLRSPHPYARIEVTKGLTNHAQAFSEKE